MRKYLCDGVEYSSILTLQSVFRPIYVPTLLRGCKNLCTTACLALEAIETPDRALMCVWATGLQGCLGIGCRQMQKKENQALWAWLGSDED
jgi:hypothetical protein